MQPHPRGSARRGQFWTASTTPVAGILAAHSPPGAGQEPFPPPRPVVREGVSQIQPVRVEQGVGVAPGSIPNTAIGVKQREEAIRGSDEGQSADLALAPNQP